ncbi:MAG: site-specific DNA-methyltransferase [Bacteroidetes bacterium]|nr:site-specific DNA-methyltransferase [Bacteroidota bacterium]
MAVNPEKSFKILLRELFQLDNTDLDFGIYRILNLRSKDVEKFINKILPSKLKSLRDKLSDRSAKEILEKIDKVKKELKDGFEVDFDNKEDLVEKDKNLGKHKAFKKPYQLYLELKDSLDDAQLSDSFEKDTYNELFRFFRRYYEGGDFISMPRSGENSYMIPYNGEEVKLHWANHDQYYIKTGENFKNYVFTNGESKIELVTVDFRLKDADTPMNNNQDEKKRRFVPTEDYFKWNEEKQTLEVWFEYKIPNTAEKRKWGEKQNVQKDNKGINQKLILALKNDIAKTKHTGLIQLWDKTRKNSKNKDIPLFTYHLKRFTSINSFDFFIHKNLGKFLKKELDYFIKNEVLSLNFCNAELTESEIEKAIQQNTLKATAIHDIAHTIIEFLHELEEFQRKLFEKKKFVVQNDYCMTLDLIPKKVKPKILDYIVSGDKNKKQLEEWKALGFITTLNVGKPKISKQKYMMLDTKFLPPELKDELFSNINNLDEMCGNLLINSENWQAINLLTEKYKNKIKGVYIDPPYNAKSSEIVYKNTFKHSSWVSLMENRIATSINLLNQNSCYVIAIDENEQERFGLLLDLFFRELEKTCVSIIHNPRGIQGDSFSYCHEYAYFLYPNGKNIIGVSNRKKGDESWRNFRDNGGESERKHSKNCFYPIILKDNKIIGVGSVPKDKYSPNGVNIKNSGIMEVWPIDDKGIERKWRYAKDSIKDDLSSLRILDKNGIYGIQKKKDSDRYKTVWYDSKYDSNEYGSKLLKNILGEKRFSFPKSLFNTMDCLNAITQNDKNTIVLDYFGGSSTTAHAVIKLNREDGGNRKYILVEMGQYFDTVTKPRIQKVVFSDNWKNGKPQDTKGISHCFQYMKLEQYEDSLNNIHFSEDKKGKTKDLKFSDLIKYTLQNGTANSPSLLALDKFQKPFSYEMDIVELNERKSTNIDLVTTFNFLLGIQIKQIFTINHQNQLYRIVLGKKGRQNHIIVWREFDKKLDLQKERDWIKKQRWFNSRAKLFCNVDNAFSANNIESEFKRLMFVDLVKA